MEFEFKSILYKRYLWISLCLVLIWDLINYAFFLTEDFSLPVYLLIIGGLGIILKLSILFTLIRKKGPVKSLVGIWGGFMILGAVTGVISLLTSLQAQPLILYVGKIVFLIFGLSLVVPLSKSVEVNGSNA